MENSQRPAHPTNGRMHGEMTGLTKRELIAAMAMQGMLAGTEDENTFPGNQSWYAKHAIEFADELLKQLEQ